MCSEFWKGVSFLNKTDSDAGQHQRAMAGPSNPSADSEGFSEVPKNMALLQPVVQKLIDKVIWSVIWSAEANTTQDPPKGVSVEWLSKARYNANFLKKWELIRKEKMEDLLSDLENEMVLVDVLAGGDGKL